MNAPVWLKASTLPLAVALVLLQSCGSGSNGLTTLSTQDTAPQTQTSSDGVFTLAEPTPPVDAAGLIKITVGDIVGTAPAELTIQGLTFVAIPSSSTTPLSYVAVAEDALIPMESIEAIVLDTVSAATVAVEILDGSSEGTTLIFEGNPTEVTFRDYVIVLATSLLPPASRTAENIATRANELFPVGNFMAADLDPVPNGINTDFVAGGQVPAPDFDDALAVYAAFFLPPAQRTPENLAALINAVASDANVDPADIIAIPGGELPGGVIVEPFVTERAAGTFQISVQISGLETPDFVIGAAEFIRLPGPIFPGFTSYGAGPQSSFLEVAFDQVDIDGVDSGDCVIVHQPGQDPLIKANQIATSAACGEAPFVRGQAVDLLENVNAELLDVTPNGAQAVLVGGDDLTLITIGASSLSEAGGFDFDDLGIMTPPGFGEADLTGVDISPDGSFALVGVKEGDDLTNGLVLAVELPSLAILGSVEVGIGPDSVAIAPNGLYAAVANEAEGDEENLPTLPPGTISILDLTQLGTGVLTETEQIDITGGPILFPNDPQPETVKISSDSTQIIASLQENNGVSLIDVISTNGNGIPDDFMVNNVDLGLRTVQGINVNGDVGEGECLSSNGYADALPPATFDSAREPDGIAITPLFPWFVTADEDNVAADLNNGPGSPFGARSISVFRLSDGALLGDSGNSIEESVVDLRLPMRCEDKGPEPEVVETGEINGRVLVFTSLERSDAVTIHDVTDPANIILVDTVVLITNPSDPNYVVGNDVEAQLEPEGLAFISQTNQLVTANSENDTVSLINLIVQ